MESLLLDCFDCSRKTELSVKEQRSILAELTRPAHVKVIECGCGKFQFILRARRVAGGRLCAA